MTARTRAYAGATWKNHLLPRKAREIRAVAAV